MLLLLASFASAADLAVVGVHVGNLTLTQEDAAAAKLAEALSTNPRFHVLAPDEFGRRISGTEHYILDNFALGGARDRVKEAQVLYDRAELDQVVPLLDEVVEDMGGGLAYATDARDLQGALVLQGMALLGMGNEDGARGAFRRAATLDPAVELDPVNHPPNVIALYDEVRTQIATLTPAHLSVTASTDATVYLDGKSVGATPVSNYALVPGEHYLLVRAKNGASAFHVLDLSAGQSAQRDDLLERHGVGEAAADSTGRSRQTKDLYRAVGAYSKGAVLVLAGTTPTGVAVQLYSPSSGTFSRALTSEGQDDPVGTICELAPTLLTYLSDSGDIRADRVSPQVVPLDIGTNDTLAELVFEEKAPETIVVHDTAKAGVPWWVWAGAGAVVAGGGATAAVLLLQDDGTSDTPQGTITVGPVP